MYKMCKADVIPTLKAEDFPNEDLDLSVAYNNKDRISINKMWMDEYSKGVMAVPIPKHQDNTQGQDMKIYAGLPLQAAMTSNSYNIKNSQMFRVLSFNDKKQEVTMYREKDDKPLNPDEVVRVDYADMGRLFNPGYCLSIYKTQGITIRRPYTIYQFEKMQGLGDKGQRLLYVALSRAADKSLINIAL
jgi:ATP-dependent exoDNAse (exonuclease V) alpha subunit